VLTLAIPAFQETANDDWLKHGDLAVTFQDRCGVEVGKRGVKHEDAVPLEELPDYFIKAVLATEDRRFFTHFGIDIVGAVRALTVDAKASGVIQGGSSITQQLAKNLFLSNERSIERKIKEAYLALWLENHLTKREILELYLDRAYMGAGAFGVQAAAQTYFGKSARDINLAEAAMLAGLFKASTKYSPLLNLPAARARADDVMSNLVDAGFMTEGQVYAARRNPATPIDHSDHTSPDWYLDFAFSDQGARGRRQARRRADRYRAHGPGPGVADQGRDRHRDHAARQGASLPRASGGHGHRDDGRPRAGDGGRT
jgi:penicillin-binding protein 1A